MVSAVSKKARKNGQNETLTPTNHSKVRTWRVSEECEAVLKAAEVATKKPQSFLIDRCLTEHLPQFVAELLAKRKNPLGVDK